MLCLVKVIQYLQALSRSGVPRDHVFITTKIHPQHLGYQSTLDAAAQSLTDLGTSYVDLLMLHYSHCFGNICKSEPSGTWKDSWQAMEELVKSGKVLSIGVAHALSFCGVEDSPESHDNTLICRADDVASASI